jgi:hypothetical protein
VQLGLSVSDATIRQGVNFQEAAPIPDASRPDDEAKPAQPFYHVIKSPSLSFRKGAQVFHQINMKRC